MFFCKMASKQDGGKSSYEKPPPPTGPTDADDWPNGLASWPSVLLTASFVALFNRNTFESWQAAVKLVRTAPSRIDVDMRLLPSDDRPQYLTLERLWLTFWSADNDIRAWKFVPATEDSDNRQNERLIVYIFDILQSIRTKIGQSDVQSDETITRAFFQRAEEGAFGTDFQQTVEFRAVGSIAVPITNHVFRNYVALAGLSGQHIAVLTGRPSTVSRIVRHIDPNLSEPDRTEDGFYAALNMTSRYECCPFFKAVWSNNIVLAAELLKNLPILELDVYGVTPFRTDIGCWQSPEYWSEDDRFHLLIGAARGYMARYRRERAVLLRLLLADFLPYDVFGLIDSYGAQPEIIRRRRA